MNGNMQSPDIVAKAYARIAPYIHKTPLLRSQLLNEMLGCNIYFKIDALQKTGAFKIRGVLNHLLSLREQARMPAKIVSYSTGNHALAMAYAGKILGVHARVYLPEDVSPFKREIAERYEAEIITVKTRREAEMLARNDSISGCFHYLAPSDDDLTIAGAGTMCYEALMEMKQMRLFPEIIFAPCGGGGLLAGSYLAKELVMQSAKLHGVEPAQANDAYRSLKNGNIFRFNNSPLTIADGLKALSVSERTFEYLKKLDDFHVVEEEQIRYWTAWLIQMMQITSEPSAAISMAAANSWLKTNRANTILILITGGNIDSKIYHELSKIDLLMPPARHI